MANRDILKAKLESNVDPYLAMELRHYMSVDREDPEPGERPYDLVDAFEDAYSFAEDHQDKKLLKICRQILIDVGYYKPMTQQDIQNTVVTSGTVWDFKLGGIPYKMEWGWMDK